MALPELFANPAVPGVPSALTTLSGNGGSITSSATSFNTAAAAPVALQGSGQFRILIDSELMIVTAGASGFTWTVTRGAEGSTAASHTDGALIYHILTAGALAAFPQTPVVNSFNGRTGAVVPSSGDYIGVPAGGLTGATTAFRMVGATGGGAPTTGTFVVGDIVLDRANAVWYRCTVAGSPGTWVQFPSGGSSTLAADTDVLITTPTNGQVLTYVSAASKWENQAPGAASGFPYINIMASPYNAAGDGVTDDSTPLQNAITDASTLSAATGSRVNVVLPAGHSFSIRPQITPKNGVCIWAYGARIVPNWGATNAGIFQCGTTVSDWAIYGGLWVGQGNEQLHQSIWQTQSTGVINNAVFRDMLVTDLGTEVVGVRGMNILITNNFFRHCCSNPTGALLNCINFGGSQQVVISNNVITDTWSAAIAGVYNLTGTFDAGVIIANNYCQGDPGVSATDTLAGCIDFESTLTGNTYRGFVIANNVVIHTGGAPAGAINISDAQITECLVIGNRCTSTSKGVHSSSTSCSFIGNSFRAPTPVNLILSSTPLLSNNRYSDDRVSGRATLVAGTVTVSTAEVVANDNIILSCVVAGGTRGFLSVGTITAGTSFVINSSSSTDTSTVFWKIDH